MILNDRPEGLLDLNSLVLEQTKEQVPTDYCSSFSSNNCNNLLQSQKLNFQKKNPSRNNLEARNMFERLQALKGLQSNMSEKFQMCLKKLECELQTKEAKNDILRGQIVGIKKDIRETKKDVLLIKEYLSREQTRRIRMKRGLRADEEKDRKQVRHYRIGKC